MPIVVWLIWAAGLGVAIVALQRTRQRNRDLADENVRVRKQARELFDATATAIVVTTPDGRILNCNQSFAQLVGVGTVEEVLAAPAEDLFEKPEDRDRFLSALR